MRFSFLCVLGCADPFAFDRHNLNSFRILEAHVMEGRADAVVWSGDGIYHQESPQLRWMIDGDVVAEGFDATVPLAESYELEVEATNGEILFADVVPGVALSLPPCTRKQWKEEEEQAYDLQSREEVTLLDGPLQADSVARLELEIPATTMLRWSTDAGTILELSQTSTDVFTNHISFEEDVLVEYGEEKEEEIHVFVLALDGQGGSGYSWIDLDFKNNPDFLFQENMILPIDSALDSGLYSVLFEMTDTGFVLSNPQTISTIPEEIPHSCMDSALLNLNWLRQGRCTRSDLDGLSVVVRVP